MRTASIKLEVTPAQSEALGALRTAYAEACNVWKDTIMWGQGGTAAMGFPAGDRDGLIIAAATPM